ncbi:Anaphase-promoting complex subunit 10 [Melia azedarach]|uniref:Anaphase-promoting complex subunit 10 n=1 Tax=Melia azedarach TaxID=155640 RepID=A0ACC1XT98_MELAZ|nr:Anaphase-promoting complex subunit 10 [Melia azedarach]
MMTFEKWERKLPGASALASLAMASMLLATIISIPIPQFNLFLCIDAMGFFRLPYSFNKFAGFRSDGAQPYFVNILFQKKGKLQLVVLYVDFKLDESYTPGKISIRAGDGFHNLKNLSSQLDGSVYHYLEMILGKLLSILLCCKFLCCQTTLMEGIVMCARSKFMALDRTLFRSNNSLLVNLSLTLLSGEKRGLAKEHS